MKTLLIILAILFVLMSVKKESFTEVFGFAGYDKPMLDVSIDEAATKVDFSEYQKQKALVSPDILQDLIFTVQAYLKKQGMCTYGIETNNIEKFVNKTDSNKVIYRCRFMFLQTKGFPFGFGVSADILMAPKPTLISIQTQPRDDQTYQPVEPFVEESGKDFLDFNEVQKQNIPNAAEFNNVVNSYKKRSTQ